MLDVVAEARALRRTPTTLAEITLTREQLDEARRYLQAPRASSCQILARVQYEQGAREWAAWLPYSEASEDLRAATVVGFGRTLAHAVDQLIEQMS